MGKAGSPLQPLSSGVVHIHAHAHTHLTLACTTSPPQHGEKARFLPPGLLLQTLGKPKRPQATLGQPQSLTPSLNSGQGFPARIQDTLLLAPLLMGRT